MPLALMHGASSSPSGVTVGAIPTNIPRDLNPGPKLIVLGQGQLSMWR